MESTTRLRAFIPNIGAHPPGMAVQKACGSSFTASALVSDVFAPTYINGVWPLLRLVSVAQKNRSLIMLTFIVLSIDLPNGAHGLTVLDGEIIEWRNHCGRTPMDVKEICRDRRKTTLCVNYRYSPSRYGRILLHFVVYKALHVETLLTYQILRKRP